MRGIMTALLVVMCGTTALGAEKVRTLEIGSDAPEFSLPGVDGKTHSLKDFAAAKVLVMLFTCNHCPTAQAYEKRIAALHADYKGKGVALVAISPNDPLAVRLDELGYTDLSDSLEEMKLRAKEAGFAFAYLYDGENQKVSRAYGAVATPHVFIFDANRKLRYQGRIDDSDVKEVKSHDARNAIEALLAGKAVAVKTTRVFGCSTKWADKQEEARRSLAKWDAEMAQLAEIDAKGIAELVKNETKKLRLINVWATWCGPCVSEMPELVTMHRMYRKRPFEMITLSVDAPEKKDAALAMLNQMHVSATNFIYSGADKDKLAEALDKQWQGPIPHTILVAPGGKIIWRHTGAVDPLELKRAIVGYLGRTY